MKNEELILQMLGELKAGQEKLETEVLHIPDREPHMHGELAPLRRRGAPQFPNKFRGKALPAGEAGRARDQSSYSGIGMPLSDKIVSNN